jgi:hypothetical protein
VSGAAPPPEPEPEPDSGMSCGENPVVSAIVTAPLMLPLAVGEKVTAILHFALEASPLPQLVSVELIE